MRRYFSFSILAAFSLYFLGCEQLSENNSDIGQSLTVNATYDNGNSKATVVDGGTSVYWEPNDEIKVFCGQESGRLVSTNVENSKTATFTGTVSGEVNPSTRNKLYALYPYREDASFDDGVITTILPEVQTAVAGSFDRNANIAIAVSDSTDLVFRNVCGGLRFTLENPGIKRIVFESNGGEYISGEFSAQYEDGVPVVKEVKNGRRMVILETEDGSAFETGAWYYMSFLPCALAEGYTITFMAKTQTARLSVNKEQMVKKGTYGTVYDIDNNVEWEQVEQPEQYDYVIANDFADWDSACFGKDGDLIMLKDYSGEDSPGRAYMLLPSYYNGLDEFYASFDENDIPEMVHINGMNVKVLSIQDGLADVLVNFGDTLNVLIDSLAVPFDEARTKSFSENNGVRNACAIAKLVIGVIEVGGGAVLVTASGASLPASGLAGIAGIYSGTTTVASGCLDVMGAYTSLFAPASQTYDGSLSNPIISTGININNQAFDYYISTIADEEKTKILNRSLDAGKLKTANSILAWLSNGIDWIDSEFGRTITERDRALMKYIGFSVITGVLKDEGGTWATLSAYVGPDPNSKCSSWECGLIIDGNDGFHDYYRPDSYGYFDHKFSGLKHGMTYSYRTYFHDKEHEFLFWGQTRSFTTNPCPDDEHVHAIDLGLSVKWACYNVGATKPEEYGGYYAWGETEEKSVYNDVTYPYLYGTDWDYDGYYEHSDRDGNPLPVNVYGIDFEICGTEYDVAHVKWGDHWRMPTYEEMKELLDNCTSRITTMSGTSGLLLTSKINGECIFLPAAGYREEKLYNKYVLGAYWTSTRSIERPIDAYAFSFDLEDTTRYFGANDGCLSLGLCVRPVFIEDIRSE